MNDDEFKDRNRKRGLLKRATLIKMLGGKCSKCGYYRNHSALHFHHRNPEEKEFSIDARRCNNTKMETLIKEVEKCDLLCSNCHMEVHNPESSVELIEQYAIETQDTIRKSTFDPTYEQKYYCCDCGCEITRKADRCISCSRKQSRKADRPSKEELFTLITTTSFVEIGRKFGVSDNAVRKWCKSYDLPTTKKEIKALL